jgi:hypothetical protein
MTCPKCSSELYDKEKIERTSEIFVSIRCTNPVCDYFGYETRQKREDCDSSGLVH